MHVCEDSMLPRARGSRRELAVPRHREPGARGLWLRHCVASPLQWSSQLSLKLSMWSLPNPFISLFVVIILLSVIVDDHKEPIQFIGWFLGVLGMGHAAQGWCQSCLTVLQSGWTLVRRSFRGTVYMRYLSPCQLVPESFSSSNNWWLL